MVNAIHDKSLAQVTPKIRRESKVGNEHEEHPHQAQHGQNEHALGHDHALAAFLLGLADAASHTEAGRQACKPEHMHFYELGHRIGHGGEHQVLATKLYGHAHLLLGSENHGRGVRPVAGGHAKH